MIEDMTIRNLSPAIQQSYVHAVSKFSRYFGHSPDRLGLEDVRAYQVHLISKGISWASLNQVVCALRFFYGVTLGCDAIPERIAYAREPRKLPAVLSADEVVRFLEAVSSLKARVAYEPVAPRSAARLEALPDWRWPCRLPQHLKAQVCRELDRLELLLEQIKAVEAERDALLNAEQTKASAPPPMLLGVRGVGPEFASVLWSEGLPDTSITADRSAGPQL